MARKSKKASTPDLPDEAIVQDLVNQIRETLEIYYQQAIKGRRGLTDAQGKWIQTGIQFVVQGAGNFDKIMGEITDPMARFYAALIVRDMLYGGITLGAVADPLAGATDILERHLRVMAKSGSAGGKASAMTRLKKSRETWRDDALILAREIYEKNKCASQVDIVNGIKKYWPKGRTLVGDRQLHNVVSEWISDGSLKNH